MNCTVFVLNDDGLWCNACGELIAAPWNMDDDYEPPENCPTCGFPDDGELMLEYFEGEE